MRKKITFLFVFCVMSSLSFGQIFITEMADPKGGESSRYVELFNAGDAEVDLSTGYGLQRYTNGTATPQETIYYLTGKISANGFYIMAINAADFQTAYGFAPDQEIDNTGGPTNSNGDDQIQLVKVNTDIDTTVLDIFGVPGEDGSGTCHGFEDGRAERVATVTTGNDGTWNEANWNVWGAEAAGCTSHITQTIVITDNIFDPGQWIGYVPINTVVSFELLSSVVEEDGTSIDICATITNPDAENATIVDISITDLGTTVNGVDFTEITFPYTLTFPAGSSDNQCLTVNIIDDTEKEVPETLVMILENATGGASVELGTQTQHSLLIKDNDIVCPGEGAVIFTEVMQNPDAVGDAAGEWFEIHNTTDADIDIFGMEFRDDVNETENFYVDKSLIIPANGYLVFAVNEDPVVNGGLTPDFIYQPNPSFTLANSTDGMIFQCAGVVIDQVIWDDGATFPDPTGASMSLMTDHLNSTDNDDGANWEMVTFTYGAGDAGSPGCSNDAACCNLVVEEAEVACDAVTVGVDTYTASIAFSNGGTSTFVVTASEGTVAGDDPSTMASGTISITGISEGVDITVTIDNSEVGGSCNFISSIDSPLCFTTVCAEVGSVIFTEIMQNPSAVSDDNGEWFELYNTTDNAIEMQGWVIVDDDKTVEEEGFTIDRSLIIDAGGYLLFSNNQETATNGGLPTVDFNFEAGFPFLGNGADGLKLQCAENIIDMVVWDGGTDFPDPAGASMYLNIAHLNATDNDDGANWGTATEAYGDGDLGTPGLMNVGVFVNENKMSDFIIYPNPVTDGHFTIRFTEKANRTLKVYNMVGKVVFDKLVVDEEQIIDANLNAGIYILRVTENGKSGSYKLVIQ